MNSRKKLAELTKRHVPRTLLHFAECTEEEVLVLRPERESDFPKRLYAKLLLAEKIVQFQLDSGS